MLKNPAVIHVGGSSGLSTSGMISLPGCKSSLTNSQSITSSGSPGLNEILGGGIPVGTLLIFEEKPVALHSLRFLHIISAEGISLGQRVAVATPPDLAPVEDFVSLIPCRTTADDQDDDRTRRKPDHDGHENTDKDSLRIAWRYESAPIVNPVLGPASLTSSVLEYDLGKRLDPSKATGIATFKHKTLAEKAHELLLKWITTENAAAGSRNLLRVVLPSIDSPLWDFADIHVFCQFLFRLRSLVRHSNTIVCMTISADLHDFSDVTRIRRQCDAYINVETFPDGVIRNPLFTEFQAICRLQKGFTINALRCPQMRDYEFGLKIKKRRITFERLHLPPELGDTTQREGGGAKKHATSSGLNCQSVVDNGLDF